MNFKFSNGFEDNPFLASPRFIAVFSGIEVWPCGLENQLHVTVFPLFWTDYPFLCFARFGRGWLVIGPVLGMMGP